MGFVVTTTVAVTTQVKLVNMLLESFRMHGAVSRVYPGTTTALRTFRATAREDVSVLARTRASPDTLGVALGAVAYATAPVLTEGVVLKEYVH